MADNQKMIENLFAELQTALFLGDPLQQQQCATFMQPGQFISTNIVEADGTKDMYNQAQIANLIFDTSFLNTYKDTGFAESAQLPGTVDRVYEDIMNHEALPNLPLTPDQLSEINTLRTWLMNNQDNYSTYETHYYEAIESYETEANSQHPDPAKLLMLNQKESDAMSNWQVFGQKDLYEKNQARYVYLNQENPTTYWNSLKNQMVLQQKNAAGAGNYYQTLLAPAISDWGTASWETFDAQISEADTTSSSRETSWSGGVSGGWGLFSFGGGASGSTQFQYQQSQVSSVHLKFDYLRVKINRPWMVEDVFGYTFWTWNKQFGGQVISDGGNMSINPPVRPLGRMPVLPEYLIVVRNLQLSASFSKQEQSLYASQIQTKASFGFGPFSLSGSYSEANSSSYTQANFDGVTFTVTQPQIIARTGTLLGACPNPDRSLAWQDDAWFPGGTTPTNKLIRQNDHALLTRNVKTLEARQEAQVLAGHWLQQKLDVINRETPVV